MDEFCPGPTPLSANSYRVECWSAAFGLRDVFLGCYCHADKPVHMF